MEYVGLTEDEMLDVIVAAEGDLEAAKSQFDMKLRDLGVRDEEIANRMRHFEATYLVRKLIAENNRRIADNFGEEFDVTKKDIFI